MGEYSTSTGSAAGDSGVKRIPMNSVWTAVENCLSKKDYTTAKAVLAEAGREAASYGDLSGGLQVLHERIALARKLGDYAECDVLCNKANELITHLSMQSTPAAASVFINIADTLIAEDRYRDALHYLTPARDIARENRENGNEVLLASASNSMGVALTAIGEYEKAKECYEEALSILLTQPEHVIDTAATHINLAHLMNAWTGDDEEVNTHLITAFKLLDGKDLEHDYRYADACLRFAESFDFFGFFLYKNQLRKRAAAVYGENE
ncbi:MAG: tetratricopeptide repeat protein [Lachnospiraceae bacterium]|nr:tetratricopeptide repeat protein [Lachnospiraceae bacterium]